MKIRLFIGSSTEARNRGIVSKLVSDLSNEFDVHPWYSAFDQGSFTLEMLLSISDRIDAALLVFSNDDARESRGKKELVTRDNVILEYGLFVGQLGRDRVWILKEAEAVLPVDLAGLTYSTFTSMPDEHGDDSRLVADLDQRIREIKSHWRGLPPRPNLDKLSDSGLGLVITLMRADSRLKTAMQRLITLRADDKVRFDEPFVFDSTNTCIDAYTESLDLINKRFWATTYLSSGFWNQDNAQIIDANKRMLNRIQQQGGDARRLFLINRPLSDDIQKAKQELIRLRREEQNDEINRLKNRLARLERDSKDLVNEGFQQRVAFASFDEHRLPREIEYEPGDSEIAIYDSSRVDIFGGGSLGRITDMRIYSSATKFFEAIQSSVEQYFEELWKQAVPYEEYLERLKEAYESAELRIDYVSNWLGKYEFGLKPEDENLKIVEEKRVEEILRKLGRWGHFKRCLDVGTCTARYPMALRDAISSDGNIIGIDDDIDCVNFSIQKTKQDKRISILNVDFAAVAFPALGKFDLITCMLGTLSHFGWNRQSADLNDVLQSVLERMTNLLAKDGLLILSTWSEYACINRQMLDIYLPRDRDRLANWTPTRLRLMRRLDAAGLVVLEEAQPEPRLDLYVCQLKGDGTH
jgi:SAM-dependent methyltransferase